MDTKYFLVPYARCTKEGAVVFGDAAAEIDIQAQFTAHLSRADYGKSPRATRIRLLTKESEHEKLLARDQSFFENIDRQRDKAEKRERVPRLTGNLSGQEFRLGVQNALDAKAAPNLAIGKILADLSDLSTGTSQIVYTLNSRFQRDFRNCERTCRRNR